MIKLITEEDDFAEQYKTIFDLLRQVFDRLYSRDGRSKQTEESRNSELLLL